MITTDSDILLKYLKEPLLTLSVDWVPNVRILVAETLSIILSTSTQLYFDKEINLASVMMKRDKDADVRDMLKQILNDSESDGSRSRTESVHNDESGSEIHEDKGSE